MAYVASLSVSSVTDDTGYIVVDKSDTTNFPHPNTSGKFIIKAIYLDVDVTGTTPVVVTRVGTLTAISATTSTTKWLLEQRISAATRVTLQRTFTDRGVSDDGFIGTTNTNNTRFQTDVNNTNPAGSTTAAAVGDIVAEIEEVSGTATINAHIHVEYEQVR